MNTLSWTVVGPGLGFLVILGYLLFNQPLGVVKAYANLIGWLKRESGVDYWRLFFFFGLVFGGFLGSFFIFGKWEFTTDYGILREHGSVWQTAGVLFGSGILMGFGARTSGGCTMGHGLCGNSSLSFGSLVSTGIFMTTAVLAARVMNCFFI